MRKRYVHQGRSKLPHQRLLTGKHAFPFLRFRIYISVQMQKTMHHVPEKFSENRFSEFEACRIAVSKLTMISPIPSPCGKVMTSVAVGSFKKRACTSRMTSSETTLISTSSNPESTGTGPSGNANTDGRQLSKAPIRASVTDELSLLPQMIVEFKIRFHFPPHPLHSSSPLPWIFPLEGFRHRATP